MSNPSKEQKIILLVSQALIRLIERSSSQRNKLIAYFKERDIEFKEFESKQASSTDELAKQIIVNVF